MIAGGALAVALLTGCGSGAVTSAAAPTAPDPVTAAPTSASVLPSPSRRPRPTTAPRSSPRPTIRRAPRPAPAPQRDIVWIRTPVLTHDKDFHDLTPYLDPAVPRNWVTPVDYRDGDITIRVEIVGAHDPASVPVYYLLGWTAGAGDGYIRNGVMFTRASGVLEARMRVRQLQRVVDGHDAGDVGTGWDWRHAFGQVNGDTWAAHQGGDLYPLKVRLTVTLHPKR